MLGKWEGFSDEDLKSMCQTASQSRHVDVKRKNNEENMKISKQRGTKVQMKMDESATLSVKEMCTAGESPPSTESHAPMPDPSVESPNMSTVCLKIKNDVAYEVLDSEIKSKNDSLSEFQYRQKLMEEQNRKKKELLAQALADRKKRTHAEAHRLQKIQEELQRLDHLLSDDVAILRDRIEAASLEYTVAQKRFDRAEKEYVDAKVVLLGKLEKKELLTAHLCTIIEQNELRKAQKLSELMEKLQITAADS